MRSGFRVTAKLITSAKVPLQALRCCMFIQSIRSLSRIHIIKQAIGCEAASTSHGYISSRSECAIPSNDNATSLECL